MKKVSNNKKSAKAGKTTKEVMIKSHENSKEILKMVSYKRDIYKAETLEDFKDKIRFMTCDNMKSLCLKLGGAGKIDVASMKKFLLERFEKDLSLSKQAEEQDNLGRGYYPDSVSKRIKEIIERKR